MIQIGSVPQVQWGLPNSQVEGSSKRDKVLPISGDQSRGFHEGEQSALNVDALRKLDEVSPVHFAFHMALRTADEIENGELLKFIS